MEVKKGWSLRWHLLCFTKVKNAPDEWALELLGKERVSALSPSDSRYLPDLPAFPMCCPLQSRMTGILQKRKVRIKGDRTYSYKEQNRTRSIGLGPKLRSGLILTPLWRLACQAPCASDSTGDRWLTLAYFWEEWLWSRKGLGGKGQWVSQHFCHKVVGRSFYFTSSPGSSK